MRDPELLTMYFILGMINIPSDMGGNKMAMIEKSIIEQGSICPCTEVCPLSQALAMLSGKWKLRILCGLMVDGTLRYTDIKKRVDGITPAVLSSSLKELEADGLIKRRHYAEVPIRVEYSLTKKGEELWPILHRLAHWARGEAFDSDEELEEFRTSMQA